MPDDPNPYPASTPADPAAAPSVTPPADPAKPPADPAAPPPTDNDVAKWRRLAEKHERELAKLQDAEKKRAEAELSEVDRLKAQAEESANKLAALEAENLRRRVAAEAGLAADTLEFLTGTDEETLKAQAAKLAGMVKAVPTRGGTTTNPPSHAQPSLDEQIAAAQKAGNVALAIGLKRKAAGFTGSGQ
jgi:hypothetical protein